MPTQVHLNVSVRMTLQVCLHKERRYTELLSMNQICIQIVCVLGVNYLEGHTQGSLQSGGEGDG